MPLARVISPALAAALLALQALAVPAGAQTPVRARAKPTITVDGLVFKDLNANGRVDPYEDWRNPVAARVRDLVGRMTLEEKAGMLLINTLNAEPGGRISDRGVRLIQNERMTRFVFRNVVTATPQPPAPGRAGGFGGAEITPYDAAQFTNLVQELAEGTRLGIPALFKSNARNHFERDARAGISSGAGAFSEWPKEPGLAATRDTALIGEFGRIMRQEWTSIGLRGMYGYMADLATEPRWFRVHETFGEDADLTSTIITSLVKNIHPGRAARTRQRRAHDEALSRRRPAGRRRRLALRVREEPVTPER
jgi:beta-glucosidase